MKTEDFKTCSQSGFCKRNRAYADEASRPSFQSPYALLTNSVKFDNTRLSADIKNTETSIILTLNLDFLKDNTARVRINEKNPIKPRYDEHSKYTLHQEPVMEAAQKMDISSTGVVTVTIDAARKVVITPEPLRFDFFVGEESIISLNDRGFFNFEHLRTKESHQPKMIERTKEDGTVEQVEAETEQGLWEETFKTWTDPKPNGPESIGLDISFNGFSHVYGIPEHASSLSLKETRGGENAYDEPYRLYNTDVFEYALDSPTSLYGAVPFMVAHRKGASAGVFWMNPSETWIDIVKSKHESHSKVQQVLSFGKKSEERTSTHTHWVSEAGVLDLFVFFGPSTKDVMRQYSQLTGPPALPQMFAIGYHQCRWNYINERDVLDVDNNFDEYDMPYDVIWLDIEYTDEKKYFTWDAAKFPHSLDMEKKLADKGRQLVVIIDPHIKRASNYRICDEAKNNNLFVKQPSGDDYEAWCWPGQSSWVDFYKEAARDWWKKQFQLNKFLGTRENVHIWNDMNEPSIFNGPEITMQKEMIHDGRWEHRVLHNLYSLLSHAATSDGVRERTAVQKRPFVLARGFYAGVQRYGAVWTGDNMADWDALYYSNPMILTNSMGGVPFSGADIPGFFGNPSPELLARWYQAGVFQPFFRGHAHIDTKRREPYLVPEPYRSITRRSLRERYALLPYWYTLFYDAYKTGTPMMRPMVMEFPDDESVFAMQDQFMLGEGILVKPITKEGAVSTRVYFAGDEPWYDMSSFERVVAHGEREVAAPLEKIPAFYRGGHIIPRRERERRSATAMKFDPFTLVIALDTNGKAQGNLYLDDGESYDFQSGHYAHTLFDYEHGVLTCQSLHDANDSQAAQQFAKSMADLRIERIQVLGAKQPTTVRAMKPNTPAADIPFEYNSAQSTLVIKNPSTSVITCDWRIEVS
ncbi:glycosyl hydrolases family 31-domain-containing protein [Radiomyces spectabilis]|uniref:glycosyl hydrolases family 31-domain-containing protein n=1 Tax=Radiomyces spectabilis TaxID=64574 RepID=UPI00221F4562|nr:glycosyl hydrolases family 31-domain-containing protein [Radiomyces spectabilis]KAI8381483.1 glycosyl hydrolases family 31-domain-containing protein [Radiomyces spectabilis]